MKEWRVRGRRDGSSKIVELIVDAKSWAGAVAEAQSGAHQLKVRDAVRIDLEALAIGRLITEHGWMSYAQHPWKSYRDNPIFTTKDFPTAVGPQMAVIRPIVPDNGMGQLWLVGEYISEGNNALVGTMAIIPQDADDAEVFMHVDDFAARVTQRISETYAARLLKVA
jgi:hypothetical protein